MSPLPFLLCAYLAIGVAHVVAGATQVFLRRRAPDPHAPARWGLAWPIGDAQWAIAKLRRADVWRAVPTPAPVQVSFAPVCDLDPRISDPVDAVRPGAPRVR